MGGDPHRLSCALRVAPGTGNDPPPLLQIQGSTCRRRHAVALPATTASAAPCLRSQRDRCSTPRCWSALLEPSGWPPSGDGFWIGTGVRVEARKPSRPRPSGWWATDLRGGSTGARTTLSPAALSLSRARGRLHPCFDCRPWFIQVHTTHSALRRLLATQDPVPRQAHEATTCPMRSPHANFGCRPFRLVFYGRTPWPTNQQSGPQPAGALPRPQPEVFYGRTPASNKRGPQAPLGKRLRPPWAWRVPQSKNFASNSCSRFSLSGVSAPALKRSVMLPCASLSQEPTTLPPCV